MSQAAAAAQSQVNLTLPDGKVMSFATGTTGADVAKAIAVSLGKAALAVKLNGEITDLNRPITQDAKLAVITRQSDEALGLIRHSCAHIMAEAVQKLFPGTQVTIGPAIDDGFYYDFAAKAPFTPDDLAKIETEMAAIVARNSVFTRQVVSRAEALKIFAAKGEAFKVELINDLPEDSEITLYHQDKWFDLCRGPHVPTTADVGTAFKLMKVAGSYWRGDSAKAQLQRIYGTAWRDKKELDAHLLRLEEAEKRDHRKLGQQLDLFHFQDEAPGQVFWHHKGWLVYLALLDYMRAKLIKYDYIEVNTPQMLDSRFWHASGHWDKYQDNMFIIKDDDAEFPAALKPMSCPGGAQLFKNKLHSYRDLPVRMAEFGKVFRKEASGARHGLMRVQSFTQDDAHIFCRDEQLEDEVVKMCDLIREIYTDLGLAADITIYFSTRPEQRIGREEDWDRAEAALQKVLDRMDMKWVLNEGDGAFYAPKLDFMVRDAIGRQWQCGTVQVDMNMPHRLELSYIDEQGQRQTPHMVHRAILGSVERFMGILIEHYTGALPAWLAPTQVVVATITNDTDAYAAEVVKALKAKGLRVETDLRTEKIAYKVREHSLQKVPFILALGAREAADGTVAIRRFGSDAQEVISLADCVAMLQTTCKAPA